MADTTLTTPATTTAGPPVKPDEPAGIDVVRTLKMGGLGALAMTFVSMNGMYVSFDRRLLLVPVLSLGAAVFYGLAFTMGYLAGATTSVPGQPSRRHGPIDVVAGAAAGLIAALGPLLLVFVLGTEVNLRFTFPNASPVLRDLLLFGREGGTGVLYLLLAGAGAGALGGLFHLIQGKARHAVIIGLETVVILSLIELIMRQVLGNLGLGQLHRAAWVTNSGLRVGPAAVIFLVAAGLSYGLSGRGKVARASLVAQTRQSRTKGVIGLAIGLAVIIVLPTLLGSQVNELLVNVGLFMLLALGLNIVIGYAGLLHLGYVAFFAVGAYGTAVLTSPTSPLFAPGLSWWVALPLVVALATVAGLLIGAPVIGLRGDYLAIVTLGFGEIIRILFLSDWLRPYFGGSQGIRQIPGVDVGTTVVRGVDPQAMLYLTVAFVVLAVYISYRLQNSRTGRAWAALREDETTAEVMGIDTVKAKLLAFVIGAIFASLGGALFAVKVGSVFPSSYDLLVSIIVLVVVIVGGMGHIPGVMVGAVVLIGILGGPTLPGLLAELGEYKLLIYGAVLVYMMLQKPAGLVPSVARTRELHGEETTQDAWFDKKGNLTDTESAAIEADRATATTDEPTGGQA